MSAANPSSGGGPLLTAQQQALIEPLRRGRPVPVKDLVAALYAARWDGGPDNAAGAVRTMIYELRQRLAPHGVAILTIGLGRGAQGYMLDPDHDERLEQALAACWRGALAEARTRCAPPVQLSLTLS